MPETIRGPLAILGRLCLSAIFILSALGNKIPKFNEVAGFMGQAGVPQPRLMLVGAIAFLLVGGVSVVAGYHARVGAALLAVFLVLATYYFHGFWRETDPKAQADQMIQAMKNLSMFGAMLLVIAAGPGPGSLDNLRRGRTTSEPVPAPQG